MEVVAGPHAGDRHECQRHETFIVGRAKGAKLRLHRDPYFSRHHFCLEVNPPDCFFRDLGSRNGTFINGNRASEQNLRDGDLITGGKTELKVAIEPAADPVDGNSSGEKTLPPRSIGGAKADHSPSGDFQLQPIPGYDVLEEIGNGAMGIVYRATEKSTSKDVALKVILPSQAVTEDAMGLFIREASILGQLDHPRIVGFHEFGMYAGQLFLAMDYVQTVDLQQILSTQSETSQDRIHCAIACQVLEALEYAHSRSLVHRDIKPSNILVHRPKRKLRVHLADFGLTKNYRNAGFSGMTLEGDVRGTLRYIAPEQLVDSRHAKPASDIYALGATLYEFLCGRPPFNFADSRQQIVAVLEADLPPMRGCRADIPPELAAVVERALAKDPAQRFSSAEELRQALLPFSKRDSR